MSSVCGDAAVSRAESGMDARSTVSPASAQRNKTAESRNDSINVPDQKAFFSPSSLQARVSAVPPSAAAGSISSDPIPRQNSSDDLDGYRSSCEGSVPEEGCHGSRENRSRDSSTGRGEAPDATQLSSQALAALAKGESTDHASGAASSSGGDGFESTLLPPTSHHHQHSYPHHHRQMRSRPRSSISSAAREEERQRLFAMSPSVESSVAAASAPVAVDGVGVAATAVPATSRSDGRAARSAVVITPVSLADASAAESDCSSADELCHATNPLFASTNMKTSAAMLSVALDSESRGSIVVEAADANGKASACSASTGGEGVDRAVGDAQHGVLPVLVKSKRNSPRTRTLSFSEAAKSPLQGTLSRLSRSSSNDSSAVEASMECATAPAPTAPTSLPASTSLTSPLSGAKEHADSRSISAEAQVTHHSSNPHNTSGAGLCTPVAALPPVSAAVAMEDARAAAAAAPQRRAKSESPTAEASETPAEVPVITIAAEPTHASTLSINASPLLEKTHPSGRTRERAVPVSLTTAAAKDVTHVGDVAACTYTTINAVGPPPSKPAAPSSTLLTPTVDVSSSSSVGGHHLSITEGNAFLKQSGSRREEAFYNMIRPYQEALVREAVRQAPHTVEHWGHQTGSSLAASGTRRGEEREGDGRSVPPPPSDAAAKEAMRVIRHVHADVTSMDAPAAGSTGHKDDVLALCEARWEAYQQYEAQDMSALDILASAPPTTEEEKQLFSPLHRMRSDSITANSPVVPFGPDHPNNDDTINNNSDSDGRSLSRPTSPLHLVDKSLVELAARLWWTIRFRHFYRTSSSGYEVQRQAAEAAGLSPPSPSTSSLPHAARDGVVVSRCSTPASQHRYPVSPSTAHHTREDLHGTPPHAGMPHPMPSLSGTATPTMMGSFAAPSSEGVASNISQSERQYSAQKHRALQLLAAFVPRYHGTLRLFMKDVLRCERRGVAAAVAAAAAAASTKTPPPPSAVEKDMHNPLADSERATSSGSTAVPDKEKRVEAGSAATTTAAVAPAPPKIIDADNDDEDDDDGSDAGGRKICRMIMLEYVCYKFRHPCVMDIKMGSRQYGLHPTAEKKRSKEHKATLSTSGRYGIRLSGYRRWNAEESRYDFRSKLQCRALTLNEVKGELSAFLLHNRELERVYRRQLQRLRVAFSQQTVFRFYTSSLLFVYDAEDPLSTARVTMVDFAYTYESKELLQGGDPDADFAYDVGYLKAIDTLLSLLA